MSEDKIRLKNLVTRAVKELEDNDGDNRQLIAELHEKMEELLDDRDFWMHQTEGLLICACAGQFDMFHLPVDTEEYVAVDICYHLAPVFGLLQDAPHYYVLAVTQQHPKLLRGDMYDLYETDLALPESLESSLGIDEVNQKRQRQRSAKGTGIRTSGFNGRGGARDPREDDRDKFLRLIDDTVWGYADRRWPLVLAGTEAEAGEFRSISKYPNIVSGYINGSFVDAKPHDLFDQAFKIITSEIIEPMYAEKTQAFKQLNGENPALATTDVNIVTEAAKQGRIDTLLIGMRRYTTDTVRNNNRSVPRLTFLRPAPSKVANDLAERIWHMSGKVLNLDASKMPNGATLAAILRY
jgi:hypothetical protein